MSRIEHIQQQSGSSLSTVLASIEHNIDVFMSEKTLTVSHHIQHFDYFSAETRHLRWYFIEDYFFPPSFDIYWTFWTSED